MSRSRTRSPRLSTSSYDEYSQDDFFTYGPQDDDLPPSRAASVSYDRPSHSHHASTASTPAPLHSTPNRHERSASVLSTGSRRDRARAAFVFNPHSPAFLRDEAPFGDLAYDEALMGSDEEDIELSGVGRKEGSISGRVGRQTFQSLTKEEVWWMSASALSVLALTVIAIVMCFTG